MSNLINIKKFYNEEMILTGMIVADLIIAGKITDYTFCEEISLEVSHGMLIPVILAQITKQVKYLHDIHKTLELFLP